MKQGHAALIVLLFVPFLIVTALWHGYVLTILWDWFMVGWAALPEMPLKVAIGVSVVFNFVLNRMTQGQKDEREVKEKIIEGVAIAWLGPLFVLGASKLMLWVIS